MDTPVPGLESAANTANPHQTTDDAINAHEIATTTAIWASVKADYRANVTLSALSDKYSLPIDEINAKRRTEGWTRDLKDQIQAGVRERLGVLDASTISGATPDMDREEIALVGAVAVGVKVTQRMRHALDDQWDAMAILSKRLRARLKNTETDGEELPQGERETLSQIALNLANAFARITPALRKVYGLDEGRDERTYDDLIKERFAQRNAHAQAAKRERAERPVTNGPKRRSGHPPPKVDPTPMPEVRH